MEQQSILRREPGLMVLLGHFPLFESTGFSSVGHGVDHFCKPNRSAQSV
jgi:hypothetical protein